MLARRLLSPARRLAVRSQQQPQPQAMTMATRLLAARLSTIVHASPHEDIAIPDVTLWEVMEERAHGMADKPAFVDGITREALTFSELHEGAKRLAVALARDGVREGDVRGLCDWRDVVCS